MQIGLESEKKRFDTFMTNRRTIVLGDLHIVRDTPQGVIDDLVRVVEEHRGTRLVFAGDLFDLSADHPGKDRKLALEESFASQPRVRAALREHLDKDGELWLIGGNHDAAVGDPAHARHLADALGVEGESAARVRSTPWFFREGDVHFEHGHLYDPDNATSHPLVADVRSLGVHFVEEFIAPTGAFRYLNANDGTPLKLLTSAFTWYGVRGPYVVYKYFDAAFRAVAKSGPFFAGNDEAAIGVQREAAFLEEHGVSTELVATLRGLQAKPTMTSLGATFQRLYLDRVGATCALLAGVGLLVAGKRRDAMMALSAGALAMSVSWALGYDRYGGSVPELLSRGADRIAEHTGAKLVVMGHAHREVVRDHYANTGSFSFPRSSPGRPFLEIEGTPSSPRATLRFTPRS